jgi:hypothetical protein
VMRTRLRQRTASAHHRRLFDIYRTIVERQPINK